MKTNQKGFSHWIVPLAVVVLVAAVGTRVLLGSHADNPIPQTKQNTADLADFTDIGSVKKSMYYPSDTQNNQSVRVYACQNDLAGGNFDVEYIAALSPAQLAYNNYYWSSGLDVSTSATTDTAAATSSESSWLVNDNDMSHKSSIDTTAQISGNPADYYVWADGKYSLTGYVSNHPSVTQLKTCIPQPAFFTAPSNLVVTDATTDSIFLTDLPASDGNSPIIGYETYRYLVSQGEASAQLYAKGGLGNASELVGLQPATEYGFYIKAYDAAGNTSAPSAPVTVMTASPNITAPSNLKATNQSGGTSFTLNFSPSQDSSGTVTGYTLYGGTLNDAYTWKTYASNVSGNSINVTGLTPGTSYTFYLVANDNNGDVSVPSSSLNVTM